MVLFQIQKIQKLYFQLPCIILLNSQYQDQKINVFWNWQSLQSITNNYLAFSILIQYTIFVRNQQNKTKRNQFWQKQISIHLFIKECKQQGYMTGSLLKNPGPGQYISHKVKTIQYSMRPKTAYPREYFISNVEKKLTPGPGTYQQTITINNPKGSIISRSRNPNRTILRFTASRFSRQKQTLGPAHYYDQNVMKTGDYILSTNQSSGKRVFSHEKRQLKLQGNRDTPGPGSYKKPSDFGQYQKKYSTLQVKKTISRPKTAQS